jgi:hypothetical protein
MKWRHFKCFGLIPVIIVFLGINTFPALAAASAVLSIESNQIATGDMVQFSITVTGSSSAPQPEIRQIDGLDIKYLGPMSQFQFINGRTSSSIAHNYVLTALKSGNYTLGPFEIVDGQNKLTTNTVQLTVVKGTSGGRNSAGAGLNDSGNSGQTDSQLYFNFSLPKTRIYLGERIPVTFRLYVGDVRLGGSIESLALNQPEVALDQIKISGEQQQLVNGQVYRVVELTGILSPVKTGTFTLGPAKMVLPVMVRRRQSPFDDFFDDYVKRTVQLDSKNKLTVTILPLPMAGRPANFSQGIGRFQISASANPTVVKQGDPVTVQMTVSGTGNLQSITAPTLANTKGFKVYDPQRKETPDQNGAPANQVTFEQVLIPLETSVRQIGPLVLSYFDPDSGSFRQASTAAIPITVKSNPNFNAATVLASIGTGNEELGQDLIYIKDNPGQLRSAGKPVYRELWFELLQLLPLLGLAGAYAYRKRQKMLLADTPESRALRANHQANRRLITAGALKTAAKYDELLEELHLTIRQYLGEKFNLPAAGMTVKVAEALDSKGIPAGVIQDIREFFERYDYHRFTGAHLSQNDAEEFWERAVRIINALDSRKKNGIKLKAEKLASRGEINGK